MTERVTPPTAKPPLPKPRSQKNKDSSQDVSVEELKKKLRSVQSTDTCSVGSAMLKLTPPKSVTKKSPPPSAQSAAQAKLQPLIPPTAKPRKTKVETSVGHASLTNGIDRHKEETVQLTARKMKNDVVKNTVIDLLHKPTKPLPKVPTPVPRLRMKSEEDGLGLPPSSKPLMPTHPSPVPKSRNGNGNKDHWTGSRFTKRDDEESVKAPFRPVPRMRVISKESKEQALENKVVKTAGGNSSTELFKLPVPRKRVKENGSEVPAKESSISPISQPISCTPKLHSVSPASAAKRGSVRLSGSSPYARSKRKKGGCIRGPLWKAPPPPDFAPPTTPSHSPRRLATIVS